jgi:hypothetical protein
MANVPGAGPVRKEHAFDVAALERFLQQKVEAFGGSETKIDQLLQFKGGQSNPTFYIKDSRGTEFVLRKKPPGKLLPSAVRYKSISQTSPWIFSPVDSEHPSYLMGFIMFTC